MDRKPLEAANGGGEGNGALTPRELKERLEKLKAEIEVKKKAYIGTIPEPSVEAVQAAATAQLDAATKARIAAEKSAAIQQRISQLAPALQLKIQAATAAATADAKQKILFDASGKAINATTGEVMEIPRYTPTLMANIRSQKRHAPVAIPEVKPKQEPVSAEQWLKKDSAIKKEKTEPGEPSGRLMYDPRVTQKAARRGHRLLKFHEAGKFVRQAQSLRLKRQLERLQSDITQSARKTGIAAVAKLTLAQPRIEASTAATPSQVPVIEWWDAAILKADSYDALPSELPTDSFDGITLLVEHPIQADPSDVKPGAVVKLPLYLTKGEQKKIRRQNRKAKREEEQEKIRLGLLPPPEPKVRVNNMMRVLGTDAVQDPTRIEQRVRQQMAKRIKVHEEANEARKLTAEQRGEKRARKLQDDNGIDVGVSVFRVRDLSNPAKKFKVEANAKQLFLTGFVCLSKDCNVVVVEGGEKGLRKFKQLMLNRIKWSEDPIRPWNLPRTPKAVTEDDPAAEPREKNSCDLVWEGISKQRAFGEMIFKLCQTETAARDQFKRHGVEQYWDLAFTSSVLSEAYSSH